MITNDSKVSCEESSTEKEFVKQKSQLRFTLSDLIDFQNEMLKRVGLNCKDSTRENWNKKSNCEIDIVFIKKK